MANLPLENQTYLVGQSVQVALPLAVPKLWFGLESAVLGPLVLFGLGKWVISTTGFCLLWTGTWPGAAENTKLRKELRGWDMCKVHVQQRWSVEITWLIIARELVWHSCETESSCRGMIWGLQRWDVGSCDGCEARPGHTVSLLGEEVVVRACHSTSLGLPRRTGSDADT